MTLSDKLRLLRIVQAGCETHPDYRVKREPKAKCKDCHEMWRAQQQLRAAAAGAL